jgi:predicted MFS family arabinose efflux permease
MEETIVASGEKTSTVKKHVFSKYEGFLIALLAVLQFTVILDFMVLSPLGAFLIPALRINTPQFGSVVSAYAFSAGISGLLAAGFADKFDRKKLLLFFYTGFIIGTFLCGFANTYIFLLGARIITGLFGGVIGSISFAIITDLFKMEVRGRVMGFVQMAFSASQVLGIPVGLYLNSYWGWHAPFIMIAGFAIITWVVIFIVMRPVTAHLHLKKADHKAFYHLFKTASNPEYLKTFVATILLATGGFMLMPFASTFSINNLGITSDQLPFLYAITGCVSIVIGPLFGKLSDKIGKYKVFCIGTAITIATVAVYTNLGITPLWLVIAINICMFAGVISRMISASALISGVPEPQDRGAFMGINSSVQQFSGGIAAMCAGLIVYQADPKGPIMHYNRLGLVVICALLITVVMVYYINRRVAQKLHKAARTI